MTDDSHRKLVESNRILSVRTGAHLYGTATPESDEDRQGVFIPPEEFVFGLRAVDHVDLSVEATDDRGRNLPHAVDVTYYSLRKFMQQALKNNPNILEPLFVNDENLLFVNAVGRKLLEARELFPHRGLYDRYAGYARGQRQKLRREAIGDPERAAKRASHLIRLLHEGLELLNTGELRFPLAYADRIRAIKDGEWPIEEVIARSHELEKELQRARQSSHLPESARFEEVNRLTIALVKEHLLGDDKCDVGG